MQSTEALSPHPLRIWRTYPQSSPYCHLDLNEWMALLSAQNEEGLMKFSLKLGLPGHSLSLSFTCITKLFSVTSTRNLQTETVPCHICQIAHKQFCKCWNVKSPAFLGIPAYMQWRLSEDHEIPRTSKQHSFSAAIVNTSWKGWACMHEICVEVFHASNNCGHMLRPNKTVN